jgi:hypothetical protein
MLSTFVGSKSAWEIATEPTHPTPTQGESSNATQSSTRYSDGIGVNEIRFQVGDTGAQVRHIGYLHRRPCQILCDWGVVSRAGSGRHLHVTQRCNRARDDAIRCRLVSVRTGVLRSTFLNADIELQLKQALACNVVFSIRRFHSSLNSAEIIDSLRDQHICSLEILE